jgi:hypothetical protein
MNGLGTRPRSFDQLHLRRYDLYDIAYLAGGHVRVADTAVVALTESGRIRVCPEGRLVVVTLRRRHPVEAAALDAIGGRGWRDVASVRWRFEDDPRVTAIAERLQRDGVFRPITLRIPRGRRETPRRTRAGRRLLRQLRRHPPVDAMAGGTNAMAVALRSTAGMPNRRLREDLFSPLTTPRSHIRQGGQPRADGSPFAPSSRAGMHLHGTAFGFGYGPR